MTNTSEPAASDAIEAVALVITRAKVGFGDATVPVEAARTIARAAIAAYHAALPSEFGALKNVLAAAAHAYDGEMVGEMSESALAAITALEARLSVKGE